MNQFVIGSEEHGCRVDRLLRKRLALMPLATVYMLIRKGKIRIGGKKTRQDYRVQEGEVLEIDVNPAEITAPKTPDVSMGNLVKTSFFKKNFSILFEDNCLIVCNKPAGLVVHPGSGHSRGDSLIELAQAYLIDKTGGSAENEAALVHRLDRDTSGVILIAKNKRTLRTLHEGFVERSIEKEYRAICHNRPPEYNGTISIGLNRTHERNSGMKMRVSAKGGAQAVSRYEILEYHNDISSVAVYLETGKTHQIRVQMAHVGAPIIGDVRYGDSQLDNRLFGGKHSPRLFLHAARLSFKHPDTKKSVTVKAPLPDEFLSIMRR